MATTTQTQVACCGLSLMMSPRFLFLKYLEESFVAELVAESFDLRSVLRSSCFWLRPCRGSPWPWAAYSFHMPLACRIRLSHAPWTSKMNVLGGELCFSNPPLSKIVPVNLLGPGGGGSFPGSLPPFVICNIAGNWILYDIEKTLCWMPDHNPEASGIVNCNLDPPPPVYNLKAGG